MIVITGAAGFIGSCIAARLNELGRDDLILVDHFDSEDDPKKKNIAGKEYEAYLDKSDFLASIKENTVGYDIECLIHMGACSSTTCQDEAYLRKNNYEYTKTLAEYCLRKNIRYVYASSAATYGGGENGYKDDEETIRKCRPLNLYGQSKQDFDLWALDNGHLDKIVGLKFFNVFGPNEYHKDDMRSIICKSYSKVAQEGVMRLFKSYREDYGDGEQKRDFIYVKDAIEVVLFFLNHPEINGVFNVGTGEARSWNDLARAIFVALHKEPCIEYFEMPEILRDKYQYFTEADMTKLKEAGYARPFMPLETSVKDYCLYLKNQTNW